MLVEKVKKNIIQYHLLQKGDKVVIGISGGADSICLAHILLALKDEFKIKIYGVHINHCIREGTAKRDEEYVKEFCEKYKIPFFCFERDIPKIAREEKLSEEEAGRKIRYNCFREVLETIGANKIAVAHHQNDQAETLILHLCRGSGIKGLSAIRPMRDNIIRPLLFVTRREIEQYLEKNGISYQEDETNEDIVYARNKVRHEILPKLEEINPKTVEHIARTCEMIQETTDFLQKIVQSEFERLVEKETDKRRIKIGTLREAEPFLQKELVKKMIEEIAMAKKDISSIHISSVISLVEKEVGKKINLPYELEAIREYEDIVIRKKEEKKIEKKKEEYLLKEGRKRLPEFGFEILAEKRTYFGEEISKKTYTKYFDYDKIKPNVVFRHRRAGDYLIMNAKGEKKSLKRLFIDEKIPRQERDNILLLADGSHIIWIVGSRISEYYKVTDATRDILVIQAIPISY
ncbi:MAG: tRNA lysidine(34) synthetase TilS [Lachnospiraceae bacterium]